jgi:hypothetical protein
MMDAMLTQQDYNRAAVVYPSKDRVRVTLFIFRRAFPPSSSQERDILMLVRLPTSLAFVL